MTVLCLVSTIEEKRKDTLLSLSHVRLLTISLTHTHARTHTFSLSLSLLQRIVLSPSLTTLTHTRSLAFVCFIIALKNTHSLKKIKEIYTEYRYRRWLQKLFKPAAKVGLTIKGAPKKDSTLFAPTLFSLHFRSVNSVYLAASSRVLSLRFSPPPFSHRASTLSLTNQFIIT